MHRGRVLGLIGNGSLINRSVGSDDNESDLGGMWA